jgi:hypothetical protein
LASGAATDCNANGIPDSCDLASGTEQDCDGNQVPDSCDIAAGTALDCNANGVPDACDLASGTEPDCNANGIPDSCDLATGVGLDCNLNGLLDACELAAGTSLDGNANSVPDECEAPNGFSYCSGDGTATPCPCGNVGAPGYGCANSTGQGALIYNSGGASVSLDDAVLVGLHLPPNRPGLFIAGDQQMNGGQGVPFNDGILCLVVRKRLTASFSSPTGVLTQTSPVAVSAGLIQPGQTWYFQAWYRSGAGAPCGSPSNISNGLGIAFVP